MPSFDDRSKRGRSTSGLRLSTPGASALPWILLHWVPRALSVFGARILQAATRYPAELILILLSIGWVIAAGVLVTQG